MKEYDYKFSSGKGVFFTSDSHFFHANIIKYCSRPFKDVSEMNEALVHNWNSVVGKGNFVFILGDIGMGKTLEETIELVKKLNGKKVLVPGNHDRGFIGYHEFDCLFDRIDYQLKIKVEKKRIYLNHFPFLCFDGSWDEGNPTWQLYGHVHSFEGSPGIDCARLMHTFPSQYDVGVDNNNYTPISFDDVNNIIEKRISENKEMYQIKR